MFSRIVLILVIVAGLTGCGSGGSGGGRSVVAAFYPLAYAAETIGGDAYRVENLTPAGAEPHDLELSPREVGRIESAAVVLYLSHGFQPAVSKAVEQAHGKRVDALAGLPLRDNDPHVWLDPVMFQQVAQKIGSALQRPARPSGRRAEAARPRVPEGIAQLRAARDRHEPCGVRLPRGALRPAAGRDHRDRSRIRAVSAATGARDRRRATNACDDGVLRAARFAPPRGDGGTRGRRTHGHARSDRSAHRRRSRSAATTTSR